MPAKRILYFTASQVGAYSWKSGVLTQDALFENSEEAPPAFGEYVADAPKALYDLLVDIVEEDFHQESIPFLRSGDRRSMLNLKLAQRYRDTSLAMTLSLGYQSGPRREESILFASLTNTQSLQPWLEALVGREARIAGVYSVPLLAPALAKRLGFPQKRFLLISLQQAGIRQSFVDNGQIRFSRLSQIYGDDMAERAGAMAAETSRLHQYLINMRMMPRDSAALDVIVLAPDEAQSDFQRACVSTEELNYHIVTAGAAAKMTGLKSAPAGMLAERLFLNLLAHSPPSRQFAADDYRRFFNIWRMRVATHATSAAVFSICVLLALPRLMDYYAVRDMIGDNQAQERRLNTQYTHLQAKFQKTPTSTENLKALIKNYIVLEKQSVSIDKMFVELSKALAVVPQIEIERIEWEISGAPRRATPGAKPPPSPPPAAADPAAKSAGAPVFEIVQLSGKVNAAQASDLRGITQLVNQFVLALRARPGVEVSSTQLPFDLNAEKSISGDIGAVRETEVPRFTIIFSKRVDS